MLKILCLMQKPKGGSGATWYRVVQFEKTARKLGLADMQYLDLSLSDEQFMQVVKQADLFFSRLSPELDFAMEVIDKLGLSKPLIVDLDDSLEDINPLSDSYAVMGTKEVLLGDGKYLWKNNKGGFSIKDNKKRLDKYRKALRKATALTCTTFELRNELLQYNDCVAVIPNAIDLDLFPIVEDPHKEVRLIWSGGSSHYEDLAEVQPVIETLMNEYPNLHLHLQGQTFPGITKNMPQDRVHTKGWIGPDGHGYRLACADADIAICPLRDNRFNTKKSSVKFYEMGALGVPTVAKGISPYADDIQDGKNGFLYDSLDEFKLKIEKLILDPILRVTMGNEARKYVENYREINSITKDWVELMEGICKIK